MYNVDTNRVLLLDEINQRLSNPYILTSIDQLNVIVEQSSGLENTPDLTLDIRSLPQMYVNSLLKFIEDYEGKITLIANDNPVSLPILSRFNQVVKTPIYDENKIDVRLNKLLNGTYLMTNSTKEKIVSFLDIKNEAPSKDLEDDLEFSDDIDYDED